MVFMILRALCQVPYPLERLLVNTVTSQKSFTEFLDIVTFTIKIHLQGISNTPCGRSEEYLLPPITTQSIVPFSVTAAHNDIFI